MGIILFFLLSLTFETMHDDVQLTRSEFRLQLCRPQALLAKLIQRRRLVLVAEGAELLDLEGSLGRDLLQAVADPLGLDHGHV